MTWNKKQRLDDLGVKGIQRDLTQAILRLCEVGFGSTMTPAVGREDNGNVGVTIQGQSGVIDITVKENGFVSFAGEIQHTPKGGAA